MKALEQFSLTNKNILITGATGYFGQVLAWALAEAGGNVLVNSRSQERCEELVSALKSAGHSAENVAFDVADENAVIQFFEQRQGQALHCLINNAYVGGAGTIETASSASYKQSYDISVICAHNLLRNALPALRLAASTSGDASVINVASMYGLVSPDLRVYDKPEASNPPFYGAAKAALVQWTRYAACEFGPEGIRVNSISPGAFPSLTVQESSPGFVEQLAHKVPLRRVGKAHEIQGVVLLLASAASTYINGANISIDGGWTSW